MSIEKVDSNMQKGLAIIVGNNPDGILLHTANVLGNSIYFLDEVNLTENDELIYLIGHGHKTHKTIDKRDMKEIANKLIECGYSGNQKLYPVACHFNNLNDSMSNELEKELKNLLKVENINLIKKSYGRSIIIKKDNFGEMWCESKFLAVCEDYMQFFFLTFNNYDWNKKELFRKEDLNKINDFKIALIIRFGGDMK